MAQEFTVLDVRKVPSVKAERLGKFDRLVTVRLANGPTLLEVIPDESYSEEAIVRAVRAALEERGKVVGKTFTA